MNPSDEILTTRVEATMTVPVDLSTDLDHAAAAPVLSEHEIIVSITSPNPPATLVNAIAYTLNAAVKTVVGPDVTNAHAEPVNGMVVIQGDPDTTRVVSGPPGQSVLIVPPGMTHIEWPKGDDRG